MRKYVLSILLLFLVMAPVLADNQILEGSVSTDSSFEELKEKTFSEIEENGESKGLTIEELKEKVLNGIDLNFSKKNQPLKVTKTESSTPKKLKDSNYVDNTSKEPEKLTLEELRKKAFENVVLTKYISCFMAKDVNYSVNLKAIREKNLDQSGYIITVFNYVSDSHFEYSIHYKNSYIARYYDSNGKLYGVAYRDKPHGETPSIAYYYNYPKGDLGDIGINTSSGTYYSYEPDGEYTGMCEGDICKDASDEIINYRKTFEKE